MFEKFQLTMALPTLAAYANLDTSECLHTGLSLCTGTLVLISGSPEVGKTWLTTHVEQQAALGGDLFGQPFSRSCKVLHINCDMRTYAISKRYTRMAASLPPDQRELALLKWTCLSTKHVPLLAPQKEPDSAWINELSADIKSFDIVVVDNLGAMSWHDVNSSPQMVQLLNALQTCAEIANCCIILLHHQSKSAAESKTNKASAFIGSTSIMGCADSAFVLAKTPINGRGVEYRLHNFKLREQDGACIKEDVVYQLIDHPGVDKPISLHVLSGRGIAAIPADDALGGTAAADDATTVDSESIALVRSVYKERVAKEDVWGRLKGHPDRKRLGITRERVRAIHNRLEDAKQIVKDGRKYVVPSVGAQGLLTAMFESGLAEETSAPEPT